MKALVTGATGFIGSHLADLLKKEGFEVICTVRKTSNLQWLKDKGFKLIETSLENKNSLEQVFEDVDYIFHVGGAISAKNLQGYMASNRDGTKNLLEVAYTKAPSLKRFVHISSLTAVGPAKSLKEPVNEETECKPITKYGISKRAAEEEVIKFFDKMPCTIVRPPAVYGPRDTALVQVFQAVKNGIGLLIGFNDKYLSLVYIDDLVKGIYSTIKTDKAINQIYFISSDEFYTWEILMRAIQYAFNKKRIFMIRFPHFLVLSVGAVYEFFGKFATKPPVFNIDKAKDFIQKYWICSIEKAKNELNYSPETTLDEGMQKTVEWYVNQGWVK